MLNQVSFLDKQVHRVAKKPRSYQEKAINAIFDYFENHDGSPIIVMPVGSGKSLTIAEFMKQANEKYPDTSFVVVSHVSELLTQNAEELFGQWPDADVTFYSDTLGKKNMSGNIVFAGIQSIYKKAYDFRHAPDLILVDECHLISPDSDTMYRKFFNDMKVINPLIKIIGFTGTPFRQGHGMLHKGENALFTHIAYEIPIIDLINLGHLCPIITPEGGMRTRMDATGIGKRAGDFITSQMSKKFDDEALTKSCVDEIMYHGESRRKWLVFTIDIEHCIHVAEEIRSRGISCEVIHSKTPTMERNAIIDRYKNGDLRCLVNVAIFTTGFNNPAIDLLVFMRPTRSPVLYIQMAGRGIRTFPHKSDCLLLDFGGVVEELGPIDQIKVHEPKGEGGSAPTKLCPNIIEPSNKICNTLLHAAVMECTKCGYIFPDNGKNIDTTPSSAAALSSQLKPKRIKVLKVAYFRNIKDGKQDTMRVDYLCGLETYREWVCLQHSGFPREKACRWWKERAFTPAPNTVTEALSRTKELALPLYINVKKVGKFHEIVSADFTEPERETE